MRNYCLVCLFGLFALNSLGCMQTRHVEASSITNCTPEGSTSHDATYAERRWCGFWLGQPKRVQP